MQFFTKDDLNAQFQALSTTDQPNSLEFKIRLMVLGGPIFAGYFAYGLVMPIAWYLLYCGALWVNHHLCMNAVTQQKRKAFAGLVAANFCVALLFISLPIFLWLTGVTIYRVAALGLSLGAMLHSVANRAQVPLFSLGDGVANCLFMVVVALSFMPEFTRLADQFIVGLMAASMMFYYLTALANVFSIRISLREATHRSAETQKMEAIGQLTGGVAHDFNNILTVVMGNLELYQAVEDQKDRDQLAEEAYKAASRASALTAQLLAFSRQATLKPEPIEIPSFVQEFWQMASRVIPENIDFRVDVPENLPRAIADRNQFETALLNLVINARDAMPQGGRIRISATLVAVRASGALFLGSGLPHGDYVQVMVSDTGHGIPKSIQGQVFDPFFTTKGVGEGSGLGLSMAKGFAEQSQGALLIESQKDVGTIMTLVLPVQAADVPRITASDGDAGADVAAPAEELS